MGEVLQLVLGRNGGIQPFSRQHPAGGATENFGRTVGEYDCGNATGLEVASAGLMWGGGVLLFSTGGTAALKVAASSSKIMLSAAAGGVLTQGGKKQVFKLVSRIKENKNLLKQAESAGKSFQDDIDRLTKALSEGNFSAGTGSKHLFNGICEMRSRSGARVYFRRIGDTIEILAKSNKGNQNEVIDILEKLYKK